MYAIEKEFNLSVIFQNMSVSSADNFLNVFLYRVGLNGS